MLTAVLTVILVCGLLSGVSVQANEAEYTLGKELLENGDFEQGTLNWTAVAGDPGSVWYQEGVGRDGGAGMQLTAIEGKTGELVQFYQKKIDAVPGNRYLLTFDYLAVPDNKFSIQSKPLGAHKSMVTLKAKADGTWQTYTKMFEVPWDYDAEKQKIFSLHSMTIGSKPVVVDNISLRECILKTEPKSVELSYDEVVLLEGRTHQLNVLAEPYKSNMNGAEWESSDPAVATVKNGLITTVGVGTAKITFTVPNGKKATCKVTVVDTQPTKADLVVDGLTWEGGDGQVYPGTKLTFTAKISNIGTEDVVDPFDVDISMGLKRIARLTYEGGVKAGESVTVTAKPWKAVKGDHMMAVRVNPTLKVGESNDSTNNTYQINLHVAKELIKPAYDEVATIVEESGMTNLTFNDDFDDTDDIDQTASGREGYRWYVTRPYGATNVTPEDYSVQDGYMSLFQEQATYHYGLSTVDVPTWAGYTFNKGYLEFRVRMPRFNTDVYGGPAIWSLPNSKLHEQGEMWIEVDWLEYWGPKKQYPDGYYTIAMHEQWVDENNVVIKQYNNSSSASKEGFGDYDWHTLGCLWEHNRLRCFYDGQLVLEQTWEKGGIPIPLNQTVDGEVEFESVFSHMNDQFVPFFIGGSLDNPMDIDYIRVWQASDKTFEQHAAALKADGVSTTVILAAVVGVVLIAAVIGFVMWSKKKKQA